MPIEPALAESSVLLGIVDTKLAAVFSKVIRTEGIHVEFFSDLDEARKLIAKDRPSLAILEHDPPRIDGKTCRAIRQQDNDHEHQLPVVMVASQEDQASGAAAGVTDWLIKPFTTIALIAVTKFHPPKVVRAAFGSGHPDHAQQNFRRVRWTSAAHLNTRL